MGEEVPLAFWRDKREDAAPARESLHINDLINRVTDELMKSRQERENRQEPAIFEVENLTLEVNFVAQTSSELSGGIDLRVVTVGGAQLGGKRTYQDQQVHKITLTLTAVPYGTGDPLAGLESTPRFRPRED